MIADQIGFAVVVPAFNETSNLEILMQEIFASVEGRGPCQVCVVKAASTDRTEQGLDRLKTRYADLLVTTHGRRNGQSRGIWSALRAEGGRARPLRNTSALRYDKRHTFDGVQGLKSLYFKLLRPYLKV